MKHAHVPGPPPAEVAALIALTLEACKAAQSAVSNATDCLAHGSPQAVKKVQLVEQRLDVIDSEIDERITAAVTRVPADYARELLACMKLVLDLERIGDLVLGFAVRSEAARDKLEMADIESLVKMACVLEKMLADVTEAFEHRKVECALRVLRADSDVDRIRNLLLARHTEGGAGCSGRESLQVLFMAQALERAGDHAKNLAEEVCHLVTGHTVRHLLKSLDKPKEEMFIEYLREYFKGRALEAQDSTQISAT